MKLRLETRIPITKALLKILKRKTKHMKGGEGWGEGGGGGGGFRQWRMAAKATEL